MAPRRHHRNAPLVPCFETKPPSHSPLSIWNRYPKTLYPLLQPASALWAVRLVVPATGARMPATGAPATVIPATEARMPATVAPATVIPATVIPAIIAPAIPTIVPASISETEPDRGAVVI